MESTNKIIRLSVILAFASSSVIAQTTADAKKAIDAELYQKAIGSLKQLTASQPAAAENYFLLGQAYLKNDYPDSAKAAFQKGTATDAKYSLNFVGLGAVELEAKNAAGAKSSFDIALTKTTGKKDNQPNLYVGKAYVDASVPDFKAALPYLEAAILANPKDAEAYLAVGTAHRGLGDNSAAYSDFMKALEMDKNLTRAKVELGVSTKMAKAFKEATDQFNAVIATNPTYGPVYRELAETYYQWFNNSADPKVADEKIKLALQAYEKYMDQTDRSVEKRLKHADYLFLNKDFKGLEAEANEMAKMDKSNLRYLRYLGLAAYENGNYPATVQSLKEFIAKVDPKRVTARDYLYLGKGQIKAGEFDEALNTFRIAIKMDSSYAEQMTPIGKELYTAAKYDKAAAFYELVLLNPKSKTPTTDLVNLANAYYFGYSTALRANLNPSKDLLVKADSTYSKLIRLRPDVELSYLFKARISRAMDEKLALEGAMMPYLEKYVEVVEAKLTATPATPLTAVGKKDIIDAYNNLGAFYAVKEPAKAKIFWEKTVALDPANEYAIKSLATLAAANPTVTNPK